MKSVIMFEWLLLPLAILLLACYVRFRWIHRHILTTASQIPCPPCTPVLGNLLFFSGGITSVTKNIKRFTLEFKGLFCLWMGPLPIFVATDPSIVQTILNNKSGLEKDDIYKFLNQFLGYGLLTAPVPVWKKYHRLISPVLHPTNVEKFLLEFNEVSRRVCRELDSGGTNQDPKDNLFSAFVDIVMTSAVGGRTLNNSIKQKIQYLQTCAGKFLMYRLCRIWLHIDLIYQTIYRSELKRIYQVLADCVTYFNEVWLKDVKTLKSTESKGEDSSEYVGRRTMLDIVNEHPFPYFEGHQWYHEFFTMIAAATDSTVNTVRFFLLTLANYPQVQDTIREEILEVMGHSCGDVTLSDLQAMRYLESALLESLRIHGGIPVIGRRITKDIHVNTSSIKCTLPAGSRVLIDLHAMGWNPDSFPEPSKFMPERFMDSTETVSNFIPFSAGMRRCPGRSYAMILMKTLVVHLLRKYRLSSEMTMEQIEYELLVVMKSKTPIYIKFVPIVWEQE